MTTGAFRFRFTDEEKKLIRSLMAYQLGKLDTSNDPHCLSYERDTVSQILRNLEKPGYVLYRDSDLFHLQRILKEVEIPTQSQEELLRSSRSSDNTFGWKFIIAGFEAALVRKTIQHVKRGKWICTSTSSFCHNMDLLRFEIDLASILGKGEEKK